MRVRGVGNKSRRGWSGSYVISVNYTTMAGIWRSVFWTSRALGATATRSVAAGKATWTRPLSTGTAARAGVAPEDEAVFTQDHVEMREV